MDVTLLYFDGCPNWTVARDRLREAVHRIGLDERSVTHRKVATPDEAHAIGFRGSRRGSRARGTRRAALAAGSDLPGRHRQR